MLCLNRVRFNFAWSLYLFVVDYEAGLYLLDWLNFYYIGVVQNFVSRWRHILHFDLLILGLWLIGFISIGSTKVWTHHLVGVLY